MSSAANGRPAVHFPPRHTDDTGVAPGFTCGRREDWSFLHNGHPWTITIVYKIVHWRAPCETVALLQTGESEVPEGFALCVTGTGGQLCTIGRAPKEGGFFPVVISVPIRIPGASDGWRIATWVHTPPTGSSSAPRPVLTSYIGQQAVDAVDACPGRDYPQRPATGGLHVGFMPSGLAERFSGDIAEIAVFSSALDDVTRRAVVRYLTDKYGLA